MERRAELFEMGADIVKIELTEPLPEKCFVGADYRLEGTVKVAGVGAPPWVYAEVRKKEWYKPGVAEEVSYERGLPKPISGEFSIDLSFGETGDYEVTVVATPAPLSLPVVGVPPVVGKGDTMEIEVAEAPPAVFRFSAVTIDGNLIALTDHDVDSGLLLEKTTADYLDITPAFEWTGPRKTATISIKAGYKDWTLGFSPKTGAYTKSITLPESPYTPYQGELETPIRVPLTACGGLTDGAIEMVLKIAGEPDYISHIWNVYYTKAPPEKFDFDLTKPTPSDAYPEPGADITITCPLTSRCVEAVDAHAKVIIYEGSLLPGHGSKIKEYDSDVFHIEPGESKNVIIHHTTVEGTIDRRDVQVEIYVNTQLVKESEWDDVYYVGRPPEEVIDFDLTRPSVSPAEITPGTAITITCPITSACTKEQTATAKVKIYEGSFYPGHGTLLDTKTSPAFTISPGQTYNVEVSRTAVAGTIDRRDIEVEVYITGKMVKENEWDDVYYVTAPPAPPTSDIRNFDFRAQTGTYKLGDSVPFDAPYEYKGKAQDGWLTISLGTGVSPSFFTKHTFPRERVSFDEAMDWTSGQLTGDFTLPSTLEQGQTYNVRAKLETDDGKQETDTDWGVITIEEAPPPVPPEADIKDFDFRAAKGTYAIGDEVSFSAPYDYKGMKQSGQLVLELGTGIYPTFSPVVRYSPMPVEFDEAMDWESRSLEGTFLLTEALEPGRTYSVRAKLETLTDYTQETDTDWGVITIEEVAPPGEFTLTTRQSQAVGWITKEPDKPKYSSGEVVKVTSYLDSWAIGSYAFDYWDCDGEWLDTVNPINFMVLASHTLTAHYRSV